MKLRFKLAKIMLTVILMFTISTIPVLAAEEPGAYIVQPRFSNINGASLGIAFDTNNVVYIALNVDPYSHGSGVSGLIKLFDSDGNCLDVWSVSDYVKPICTEVTYQGEYGETYTATFEGYAYSNNGTAPDRLELSITGTCVD